MFSIPLCENYSIFIRPSNTTMWVSSLTLLLLGRNSNKVNEDTHIVVFDGLINILKGVL